MTDTAEKPTSTLNRFADRCDHSDCSAQAYVKIAVPFENEQGNPEVGELLFCGHHFAKHSEHVTMSGYVVTEDNREELAVKPGIGDPDDNA